MQFLNYLKAAFLQRWNLLAFIAGLGFAALSPYYPEAVAALVLAAEAGYVGLLGSHPKFQRYVDAQRARAARGLDTVDPDKTLEHILRALSPRALARFRTLRLRCRDLRQIALELKDPSNVSGPPLEEFQLEGLDRLLWVFLRLLYTEHQLARFFETTTDQAIRAEIEKVEKKLASLGAPDEKEGAHSQKLRGSLTDTLATCQQRLTNYSKARDNAEFVALEIDRLESKIRSLSELAINRHEPDFISSQVDQVVSSMTHTERTMSELDFATGLEGADDAVPELLRRETLTSEE